jgi:hypothetical protein
MSNKLTCRLSAALEASLGTSVIVDQRFSESDYTNFPVATSLPIDRTLPALALNFPVSICPTVTGGWMMFEASSGVDLIITQPGQLAQTIRCNFMVLSGQFVSLSLNNPNNIDISFQISAVGQ